MTQSLLCLNNVILKDALGFFSYSEGLITAGDFFLMKWSLYIVIFNVDEVLYMFKQNM